MLTQQYHLYTSTEQATWFVLYNRQLEAVKKFAYSNFMPGIRQLGFTANAIPNFDLVNKRLSNTTGWSLYAVPGLIENQFFFEQIHEKKFGATTWMRKPEQIDYLEEPDMFHDVFGHVPLLADPLICDFLYRLASVAKRCHYKEEVIEAIARIYWYTIEFGLVKENDELKIYGAGILSSIGETSYCLSEKATLVPFDLEQILQTPYIKDSFQEKYFVLESMKQLKDILSELEFELEIYSASIALLNKII